MKTIVLTDKELETLKASLLNFAVRVAGVDAVAEKR